MINFELVNFLRKQEKEYFIVLKRNIEVLRIIGETNVVSVLRKDLHLLNNSVLYHNHPQGSSFSESDIIESIENNVIAFFLVTEHYLFSIKRPRNGWGLDFKNKDVLESYNRCRDFANSIIQERLNKNEIRIDEVDFHFNHYIWVLFFKIYEIPYKKTEI